MKPLYDFLMEEFNLPKHGFGYTKKLRQEPDMQFAKEILNGVGEIFKRNFEYLKKNGVLYSNQAEEFAKQYADDVLWQIENGLLADDVCEKLPQELVYDIATRSQTQSWTRKQGYVNDNGCYFPDIDKFKKDLAKIKDDVEKLLKSNPDAFDNLKTPDEVMNYLDSIGAMGIKQSSAHRYFTHGEMKNQDSKQKTKYGTVYVYGWGYVDGMNLPYPIIMFRP